MPHWVLPFLLYCALPFLQDPDLFKQLNQSMADVAKIQPLNDSIEEVLKTFYSFDIPKVSLPAWTLLSITCLSSVTCILPQSLPHICA